MQDFGSRKEKYNYHNYLTCLVKSLEKRHTVVDLRNESCVSGLIKHVDGLMNIEMENVVFYDPRGRQHQFKDFFISARNIRYVHIPDGLSSMNLIEKQLAALNPTTKARESRKDNFKTRRAKRYQKEILQDLNRAQPGPSTSKTGFCT